MRKILALLPALAGATALATPGVAQASTFSRFEVNARAVYVAEQTCSDGSTAQQTFFVTGGHEEENESGVVTLNSDFLTVRLSGVDCSGQDVTDRGSGPAGFTFVRSLTKASSSGAITLGGGRTVNVEMMWRGVGPKETKRINSRSEGFQGRFTGHTRDAEASGTITVDGVVVAQGSSSSAELESFEDNNSSDN